MTATEILKQIREDGIEAISFPFTFTKDNVDQFDF